MKTLSLVLLCFVAVCNAQDVTQRPGSGSIHLSASSGGVGIGGVYIGSSGFGIFGQIGGAERKDADLPPEADFSWVSYRQEEWKNKTFFFGGVAYRASRNVTLGFGFSHYKRDMYVYGPSSATGIIFRKPSPSKTNSGPVGMIDFGASRGFGVNVFAAPGLIGGGVSLRF